MSQHYLSIYINMSQPHYLRIYINMSLPQSGHIVKCRVTLDTQCTFIFTSIIAVSVQKYWSLCEVLTTA